MRIHHLRARYHGVAVADVALLDRALGSLVAGELDAALDAALGAAGPALAEEPWAVCVPEVVLDVCLEPGSPACSARWAASVVAAVHQAASAPVGSPGAVSYATEADALLDMVRGVATADASRAWAWRRIGLVAGGSECPGPAEVAAALVSRVRWAPAVLRAAGPGTVGEALGPAPLMQVARALSGVLGVVAPPAVVPMPTPSTPAAEGDRPEQGGGEGSTGTHGAAGRIAGVLPPVAWAHASGMAEATALAALATAIADPIRARDPGVLARVARAGLAAARASVGEPGSAPGPDLARPAAGPGPGTGPGTGTTEPPARPPGGPPGGRTLPDAATPLSTAGGVPEPEDPGSGPERPGVAAAEREGSAWGGVWFLVHGLTALDVVAQLPEASAVTTLRAIVAAVTGAPASDPCVLALTGADGTRDEEGVAQTPDDEAVQRWSDALLDWLDERLLVPERAPGRGALWARDVVLRRRAGEVEVRMRLEQVDPDVRRAGLDLDPGWVWWLGSFVRFRYA